MRWSPFADSDPSFGSRAQAHLAEHFVVANTHHPFSYTFTS
jgi:hypothetical protein